jgi:hypothetical protein
MKHIWLALLLISAPAYADGIINPGAGGGGSSTIAFPAAVTGGVSGAVPCFVSTIQMEAGTLLNSGALVVGGGADNCPSTTTTGSNVLTALGNTAGASNGFALIGIANTGPLLFTDNTYDIGAAGTTRPRAGYFGTSVTIGAGSAITSSGAGGALGSNAFTSTAYASIASPTFTGIATSPSFSLAGAISAAAWTTSGIRLVGVPATLTDTSSSGTVAAAYTDALGGNTIAASSATTYTDYYALHISDPIAGTNVTMTRKWSLGLQGNLQAAGAAFGGATLDSNALAVTGTAQFNTGLATFGGGLTTSAGNVSLSGALGVNASTGNVVLGNGAILGFASTSTVSPISVIDAGITRDAAGILAQRNSTNAQGSRLYSSYTNAGNGSWAGFFAGLTSTTEACASDTLCIGTYANGSGTALAKLRLDVAGTEVGDYNVTTVGRFTISSLSTVGNTYIGTVGGGVVLGGASASSDSGDWVIKYSTGNLSGGVGQFIGWQAAAPIMSGTLVTFIGSPSAATIVFGAADAASPVAQSLGVQSVVAGNANTAGVPWTRIGSLSNGSGCGGDIVEKTTLGTAASGSQNVGATVVTYKACTQAAVFSAAIASGGSVPSLALAGGTCAGTVIAGGAMAGTVTTTGVCASTNTMTLSVMPTAPNGYACDAWDRTTPVGTLSETSTSATTVVFTFSGTTGATDIIQYKCLAY